MVSRKRIIFKKAKFSTRFILDIPVGLFKFYSRILQAETFTPPPLKAEEEEKRTWYAHEHFSLSKAEVEFGGNTNRLAPIRLRPTPPALEDNRKTISRELGTLKRSTRSWRFLMGVLPSNCEMELEINKAFIPLGSLLLNDVSDLLQGYFFAQRHIFLNIIF
jgi:hypothetical protein